MSSRIIFVSSLHNLIETSIVFLIVTSMSSIIVPHSPSLLRCLCPLHHSLPIRHSPRLALFSIIIVSDRQVIKLYLEHGVVIMIGNNSSLTF